MKLPALLALAALALAPAARAADLSGLWIVSSNLAQAPALMDCTLLQIGVTLSGWCEPETADGLPAALAGTLNQNMASWSADLAFQGQQVHLAYQATVSADQTLMSGQLSSATASGGLTATRK